jgi:hypothetical protein
MVESVKKQSEGKHVAFQKGRSKILSCVPEEHE